MVAIGGLCCHKNSALQFLCSALKEVRPIAALFLKSVAVGGKYCHGDILLH
jgi:hypothetical protein